MCLSLTGAGNGIRTRDIQLGRLTLYQLSYSRVLVHSKVMCGGGGWIRTTEGEAGRFTVCSLWPLGNPSDSFSSSMRPRALWSWRWDSNPRPAAYKAAALPAELRQPDPIENQERSHKIQTDQIPTAVRPSRAAVSSPLSAPCQARDHSASPPRTDAATERGGCELAVIQSPAGSGFGALFPRRWHAAS